MEKINRQSGIAPVAILLIVIVIAGIGGSIFYMRNNSVMDVAESMTPAPTPTITSNDEMEADPMEVVKEAAKEVASNPVVKEFTMTSYYEMVGGKASTHFSINEINVKKGDTVRIKVTNTKGLHDFTLDEYGIKKMTPLNEEVVIEFKADKAGVFKYYCSMPGHRAMGQEGTLTVME